MKNPVIAYDFHGNKAIDFPFADLKPCDIDIYMDVDTHVGIRTCGQACQNCWFVNIPKVKNKRFEPKEGIKIVGDLRASGYNIFPRYTDAFAYEGEYIKTYGASVTRVYAEGESMKPTETMKKGEAWTSGYPFLNGNSEALLDLARSANYGTISVSFHGLLDAKLNILSESTYPIKGVFHASKYEKAVNIIKKYASSAKSVGHWRLFELPKLMIQGNLQAI